MSQDSASYIDPRYPYFKRGIKDRWHQFKKILNECSAEKKELSERKKNSLARIKQQKEELKAKKVKSTYIKAIINPSKNALNVKVDTEKGKIHRKKKDSLYLIEPFHFFYRPVKAGSNILLKPQGYALLTTLVLRAIFVFSRFFREFDLLSWKGDQFTTIFSQRFGPQQGRTNLTTWSKWWGYRGHTAIPLIWDTFQMMFLATSLGALIAIPFRIICARNIVNNKAVNVVFRFLLNVIRTIPTAVLGIIGVAFCGLGNVAGIFARTIFTAGILIKIRYEYIETVDRHPYEAILSTGANKPRAFVAAIFPEIVPVFLSNIIYTFEINIRASIILGYVNAGGIGKEISEALDTYQFNKVGAILVPLFILVFALQLFSNWLKRRTQ